MIDAGIPEWVEDARNFPVAFAQVREDPLIDLAVVESVWGEERGYFVEQGLQLGAYVFDRLYRDLHGHGLKKIAS